MGPIDGNRPEMGKEKFWHLVRHKLVSDYKFDLPKLTINRWNYKHERDCADIFTGLLSTPIPPQKTISWGKEGNQKDGFRWDRKLQINDTLIYFEIHRGSQWFTEIESKTKRYMNHFLVTKQNFSVVFVVQDYYPNDEAKKEGRPSVSLVQAYENIFKIFETMKTPSHYFIASQYDLADDPTSAILTGRTHERTLFSL